MKKIRGSSLRWHNKCNIKLKELEAEVAQLREDMAWVCQFRFEPCGNNVSGHEFAVRSILSRFGQCPMCRFKELDDANKRIQSLEAALRLVVVEYERDANCAISIRAEKAVRATLSPQEPTGEHMTVGECGSFTKREPDYACRLPEGHKGGHHEPPLTDPQGAQEPEWVVCDKHGWKAQFMPCPFCTRGDYKEEEMQDGFDLKAHKKKPMKGD